MMRTESAATSTTNHFEATEHFARQLDDRDPLANYREKFLCPCAPDGERVVYFAGNSLGLQPEKAREYVLQEIEDWRTLAVNAHLGARTPWYSYHEIFSESGARLVGAKPGAGEVVFMNSLTVNIHLMLVTFYQPTPTRYKIMMELRQTASSIGESPSITAWRAIEGLELDHHTARAHVLQDLEHLRDGRRDGHDAEIAGAQEAGKNNRHDQTNALDRSSTDRMPAGTGEC